MKEANFPNCNGAIDGKHIKINYPTPSGSLYYNYKKYYSIVLLAVVDAYYRFIFLDIGSYGKASDYAIYTNSSLYWALQNKTLNIPPSQKITEMEFLYILEIYN